MSDHDQDEVVRQARRAAEAASREIIRLQLPSWLRTLGTGSWFMLGIAAIFGLVLLVLALVTPLVVPLAIAAVLAAIFVPVVDWLERLRVPRWLGATLLLFVALALAAAVAIIVIRVIVDQSDEIWNDLEAGMGEAGDQVDPDSNQGAHLVVIVQGILRLMAAGLLGSLIFSATALLVGIVLAVFMLLFLLKDWYPITTWTTTHIGLPPRLADDVLQGTVRAFRGYALGLTQLGAANALVVGVGALILDVPLVGTIALVTFLASYVPYFGACLAGAFAVFIAWGANGLPTAIGMLAIVLLANNTIQNLLEPFAFGRSLRLHPLVVLISTTAGTLLFGLMGAILAAPLTSAAINALRLLREAGMFDEVDVRPPDPPPPPDPAETALPA